MKLVRKYFNAVTEIKLSPFSDNRGYFMRTYDSRLFKDMDFMNPWVQENHSMSLRKGIIRGLHFQFPPHAEVKMVRVVKGEIMDVFVDLRKNSAFFGKWESTILSEREMNAVIIPRGFAHGFCTLTEHVEMLYHHDNYYNKEAESGIIWNDPDIGIEWPEKNPLMSDRDMGFISLQNFINNFQGL